MGTPVLLPQPGSAQPGAAIACRAVPAPIRALAVQPGTLGAPRAVLPSAPPALPGPRRQRWCLCLACPPHRTGRRQSWSSVAWPNARCEAARHQNPHPLPAPAPTAAAPIPSRGPDPVHPRSPAVPTMRCSAVPGQGEDGAELPAGATRSRGGRAVTPQRCPREQPGLLGSLVGRRCSWPIPLIPGGGLSCPAKPRAVDASGMTRGR